MKNILIIGGTGFIGYHFLKRASKKKLKLFSLSKKNPSKNRKIKGVKYFKCDFTNYKKLKILKNDFDYIINAGGYYPSIKNKKGTKKKIDSHFIGLKNIVNFFDKKKIKKFVQIGSGLEYGNLKSPLIEKMKCKPINYYGKVKLKCTKFLLKISNKKKIPISIIRLFTLYGPNQYKGLIYSTINGAINNSIFPVSTGKQLKDFCHVNDVIDIAFKILFSNKTNGEIFNVGFGKPFFVKEIINHITRKIKYGRPNWGSIKLNKNEKINLYPNTDKVKNKFNWKPKIQLKIGINNLIKNFNNIKCK